MKQTDKRSVGMHVGSASIIMIFAVLCLTVFSTLSYVTADQERKLAEKSALAIQQYYTADYQCEERYEQIAELLRSGIPAEALPQQLDVQVVSKTDGYHIQYAVSIDEHQQLEVGLLARADGALDIRQWKVAAVQEQVYEDELDVWDGE